MFFPIRFQTGFRGFLHLLINLCISRRHYLLKIYFYNGINSMNKKIYFDTTFLHYGEDLRGIPQVIFQLIRLFLSSSDFFTMRFIATKKVRDRFLIPLGVKATNIETIGLIPFISRDIRFHGFLCSVRYLRIKKQAAFIIHPEYRSVVSLKIPQMVIFHDFIFLKSYSKISFLKPATLLKKCYQLYLWKKCSIAVRVHAMIAVSEFTKSCLLHLFPFVKPSAVTVIYNGIRFPVSQQIKVKSISSTRPIQLLTVGGLDESRKNTIGLINHLPDIIGGQSFVLHLVGKCPEKKIREYQQLMIQSGISQSVIFHGIVTNMELLHLYEQCHFFLYPSLAEGFGLPIIEAMAHGCIVCAFNNTSIPEIGSNAIIIAENNDFKSWGVHMKKLLYDHDDFLYISKAAQKRAFDFSEEKMFHHYHTYFTKVLHLE
jgi:glycosyltransferase involved in cell wall biosynthesis